MTMQRCGNCNGAAVVALCNLLLRLDGYKQAHFSIYDKEIRKYVCIYLKLNCKKLWHRLCNHQDNQRFNVCNVFKG